MGWWSHDLLGGDSPLDTLLRIEDVIKVADLYPLRFDDDKAEEVRAALQERGVGLTAWYSEVADDLPVVAAVYLASGAAMPDLLRTRAAAQARMQAEETSEEDWEDDCAARKASLLEVALMIEQHVTGQRTEIAHKGLFEAMMDADQDPNFTGKLDIHVIPRRLRRLLGRITGALRSLAGLAHGPR